MNRTAVLTLLLISGSSVFAQQKMTLSDAVKLGLEKGYAVRLSKNELQVAANNNTYGNAGFLPKIDATAGISSKNTNDSYTNPDGTKLSAKPGTLTASTGLALSWTLFDGLSMFVEKDRLNQLEQLGEVSLRASMEGSVAQIITAYNTIVQQKKLITVYEEVMAVSKQRVDIARKAKEVGSGSEVTLLKTEVDYKTDSANLIQQSLLLSNQKAELNNLLGRDPGTDFDVEDMQMNVASINLQDVTSKALEQNADLTAARQQQTLSELGLKRAKAAQLPAISLNSNYTYNSYSYKNGTYDKSSSYGPYVGVTAGITLFNGFNTKRTIRNAQLSLENSQIATEQQTQQLKTTITKEYNAFTTNRSLVEIERKSLDLAKKNLEIALKAYAQGVISDIELRDTQRNYSNVSYLLLNAEIELKHSEIELQRLSGTLVVK